MRATTLLSGADRAYDGFDVNYTRRRLLRVGVGSVVVACAGCAGTSGDDSSDSAGGDDDSDGNDSTDSPPSAPSVTFDFEQVDEQLSITHEGGDTLAADSVTIQGPVGDWIPTEESLVTGDRITLVLSARAQSGDTVEVVWHDPSSDGEAVIGEYTLSG